MLVLATLLFSLPIFALAAGLHWLTGKLGWRVHGVPNMLGFLLIAALSFGSFYLCVTLESLVLRPATLQRQYLGAQIAGPIRMTSYQFTGFQDPDERWQYRLKEEDRVSLSKKCLSGFESQPEPVCVLYSGQDDRWSASVELRGNELVMHDGLW